LYEIDRALLASLQPELIVTQAQCDVCAVKYDDVLELVRSEAALRHTEIIALNPTRLEDVFADIERVARATGRLTEAAAYLGQLRGRVDRVGDLTATIASDRRPV